MYGKTKFLLYKYIIFFSLLEKLLRFKKNDLSKVPLHANLKSKKGPRKNFLTSISI
jgi:hypothetical protein